MGMVNAAAEMQVSHLSLFHPMPFPHSQSTPGANRMATPRPRCAAQRREERNTERSAASESSEPTSKELRDCVSTQSRKWALAGTCSLPLFADHPRGLAHARGPAIRQATSKEACRSECPPPPTSCPGSQSGGPLSSAAAKPCTCPLVSYPCPACSPSLVPNAWSWATPSSGAASTRRATGGCTEWTWGCREGAGTVNHR